MSSSLSFLFLKWDFAVNSIRVAKTIDRPVIFYFFWISQKNKSKMSENSKKNTFLLIYFIYLTVHITKIAPQLAKSLFFDSKEMVA